MIQELRSMRNRIRHRVLRWRHRGRPYSEFYAEVMRLHASIDPKLAVGGMWDELGKFQFDFLVGQGLAPNHRLLDIGCGCLRGGVHFIRYLDQGGYCGVDLSDVILEAGRRHLEEAGLAHKSPTLLQTSDMQWDALEPATFDFAFAFSVFTHMPLDNIEQCLANIHKPLKADGVFYATFFESDRPHANKEWDSFWHRLVDVQRVGAEHDLRVELVSSFEHPRGQRMLRITQQGEAERCAAGDSLPSESEKR